MIWINEPSRVFVARNGVAELTTTLLSHDQVRGAQVHAAVQSTMNAAAAECLRQLGFDVEPYGSAGCSLVVLGDS